MLESRMKPISEIVLEVLSKEYGWLPSQIKKENYIDIEMYLRILKIKQIIIQKNKR